MPCELLSVVLSHSDIRTTRQRFGADTLCAGAEGK